MIQHRQYVMINGTCDCKHSRCGVLQSHAPDPTMQKARKGLVSGVTSACPSGMYYVMKPCLHYVINNTTVYPKHPETSSRSVFFGLMVVQPNIVTSSRAFTSHRLSNTLLRDLRFLLMTTTETCDHVPAISLEGHIPQTRVFKRIGDLSTYFETSAYFFPGLYTEEQAHPLSPPSLNLSRNCQQRKVDRSTKPTLVKHNCLGWAKESWRTGVDLHCLANKTLRIAPRACALIEWV